MTYDPLAEIPECGQTWKWERPAGLPTGDTQSAVLYQSIGLALSAWEIAEYSVSLVFASFMEANPVAAERVFGLLQGLPTKIGALEQAAQAAFWHRKVEKRVREGWQRLRGHYNEAAGRRNEIAHGQVSAIQSSQGNLGFFLTPRHNTKKAPAIWESPEQANARGYLYTSADVGRWTAGFSQLDTWALVFENEYREKYPPLRS